MGLGLIGGSLGLALRRGRAARRVIGFSRSEATLRRALARGAVDDGDTELCPNWLGQSDLVVIATPPLSVVPAARRIAKITTGKLILTDCASTKARIVREAERVLPGRISFVGGHPMAGSELSGIAAAQAGLFRGAVCVLTPSRRSPPSAVGKVSRLWRSLGARVVNLPPDRHDALVAQVSHAPHLAAAALVLAASPEALKLSAGGFRDATRVALSDPDLWGEIFSTNGPEVGRAVSRLIRELTRLKGLVAGGRPSSLKRSLLAARSRRRPLTP
ncbi:MAG: prephenate dehydrogenase [Candidatus Omnitrophica bacterium]|nr:prephenate dehydrogenase [Candidatus Omnitrophota bacterium]